MDVRASLVPDRQPLELVQPGEVSLHHPPIRPSRSLISIPRRAIRGMIRRARNARRLTPKSYPLSACSFAGRFRRPPRAVLIAGIASSSGSSSGESCRFAPVSFTASGIPCRSAARWRFVPGLPRSVGFGPVCWPPFLPPRCCHRHSPATSRSGRHPQAGRGARDAVAPRRLPSAMPPSDASRCCRYRSPSHRSVPASRCRYAG